MNWLVLLLILLLGFVALLWLIVDLGSSGRLVDELDAARERNRQNAARLTSVEALAALSDDDLLGAILERAFKDVGDAPEKAITLEASVPSHVRKVVLTVQLEDEVGLVDGFQDYLAGEGRLHASEVADAYDSFGASAHAALVREALHLHDLDTRPATLAPQQIPSSTPARRTLADLDAAFESLEEDAGALRLAYIRRHAEHFINF